MQGTQQVAPVIVRAVTRAVVTLQLVFRQATLAISCGPRAHGNGGTLEKPWVFRRKLRISKPFRKELEDFRPCGG